MQEAVQKFKETLEQSRTVAIKTGNTKDISKILSAHIFHSAFLELEKQSSVDCGEIDESIKNFIKVLLGETKNSKPQEHTLIKIDTEKIPISELKYEKEGTILKIILQSGEGYVDPAKIQIEKEKIPVDLLLLVDPEEKEMESVIENTPHKEVVKITTKDKDIGVKTFEIISALKKEVVNKYKEAFWTLLNEAGQFSKTAMNAKKEILEMSPSTSKISIAQKELKTKNFWKLLGRTLQRSENEKELGTIWTFATFDDFTKTNQNESAILSIFNEIKKLLSPENFLCVLWQNSKKEVKAIIGGEDAEKTKNLASQMGLAVSSSYFFSGSFNNFSEAEIKIRSSIKKVISPS